MPRLALVVALSACGFSATLPPTSQADAPAVMIDAPPDATPEQVCTARYGTADRYQLCATTPTSCRFYVRTNGTCAALCSGLGGTCVSSHDGDCQSTPSIRECTRSLIDQVCTCTP